MSIKECSWQGSSSFYSSHFLLISSSFLITISSLLVLSSSFCYSGVAHSRRHFEVLQSTHSGQVYSYSVSQFQCTSQTQLVQNNNQQSARYRHMVSSSRQEGIKQRQIHHADCQCIAWQTSGSRGHCTQQSILQQQFQLGFSERLDVHCLRSRPSCSQLFLQEDSSQSTNFQR